MDAEPEIRALWPGEPNSPAVSVEAEGADVLSIALAGKHSIICAACENCHSQLSDLNEHYGPGMQVEFLSRLVADELER